MLHTHTHTRMHTFGAAQMEMQNGSQECTVGGVQRRDGLHFGNTESFASSMLNWSDLIARLAQLPLTSRDVMDAVVFNIILLMSDVN